MRKVANREELSALLGAKPKPPAQGSPSLNSGTSSTLDPNIIAMQRQVSDITLAVREIAAAMQAQAMATTAGKLVALEATIERDSKGVAQKIVITRGYAGSATPTTRQ